MSGGSPNPELIPVRADEGFDEARLAEYLRGRLEGADGALEVQQFSGGHANLTYKLSFGAGEARREYVLRRPPLGPVARGAHDMHREYRALSKLWRAFPLAPRAFVFCDDADVMGADFLVSELREGIVVRAHVPEVFGGGVDSEANRKLSEIVVDTLADFHAVEPAAVELDGLGRPDGFLQRQVEGWMDRFERAKTKPIPLADETAAWLLACRPESPKPTLLHNDWRLDNMAVAPDDPGRCVAVFDWDMCTVGDPLADLGTLLSLWTDDGEADVGFHPMPTHLPGFLDRAAAVARYAERAGCDPEAVTWYDVFGTFKMAVVLQQIYVRYERGQTRDERFAEHGRFAEALFGLASARRP